VIVALVAWSAAIGYGIGLLVQPVVDRVIADRSEGVASSRSALLAPVTGGLFAVTAWQLGWSWALPAYLTLVAFLAALSMIDIATKTLPRRMVWTAGAAGLGLLTIVAVGASEPQRIAWGAIGAAGAFVAMCVLHIVARGGFGFGDVRLGAVLGWYLGWLGVSLVPAGIFVAFVLSAVIGVALLLFGRAGRRTEVPFGPFLAAGALLVILAAHSTGTAVPI
jgi:leader peptidase (prepilin peptidase) / N-methyltransferase